MQQSQYLMEFRDIQWNTDCALVLSSLLYKHVGKNKCQSIESIDWTVISDQILKSFAKRHHSLANPENCRRQFLMLQKQFIANSSAHSEDPFTVINKIINGLATHKFRKYQTSVGSQAVELRLNKPRTVTHQPACGTIDSSPEIGEETSSLGTNNHTGITGTHIVSELPEPVDFDHTVQVQSVSENLTMNNVPLDYSKKRSKLKILSESKPKSQGNVDAVQEKKVKLSPESQSVRNNEPDFPSAPFCGKNCKSGCNCSKIFLAQWTVAKFANKTLMDPYQFTDVVDEPIYYPQGKTTNRVPLKSCSASEQTSAPRGRSLREKSRRKQEITLKSMEEDTKDFSLQQPATSSQSSMKSALVIPQQLSLERNDSAGTAFKSPGSSRYTPLAPFGWRFHADERLEGSIFSDLRKAQMADNTRNSHVLQNAGNFETSRQTRSSSTDQLLAHSSQPKNKGSVKHYDNIDSSHRARKKTIKQTPTTIKKVSISTPNLELLEVTSNKAHVFHTSNNKNLDLGCAAALVKTPGEQSSLIQSVDNIAMSKETIESEYIGGNEDTEAVPRKLILFHSNEDLAMLVEKGGLLQAEYANGELLQLQGEGTSLFPRPNGSQEESSSLLELEEPESQKELSGQVGSSGETEAESSEVFHPQIEASSEVLGVVDDDDDSSPPYEPLSDHEEDISTWVCGNKVQKQDKCENGPETNLLDVGNSSSEASVTFIPGVPQEFKGQDKDNDYDYLGATPLTSMEVKKFLEDEITAYESFGNVTDADHKMVSSLSAITSDIRIEEIAATGNVLQEENKDKQKSDEDEMQNFHPAAAVRAVEDLETVENLEHFKDCSDTATKLDSTIAAKEDENFIGAEASEDADSRCSEKSDDTEICTVNTQESEDQKEASSNSSKIEVLAVDDANSFSPTEGGTVAGATDTNSTAANEGSCTCESTTPANKVTVKDARDSTGAESNLDIQRKWDKDTDSEGAEGEKVNCTTTVSGTKIDDVLPTTDPISGDLPPPQTPPDAELTSKDTKAEVVHASGKEDESEKACSSAVIEGLASVTITICDPSVTENEAPERLIQDNNSDEVSTNAVQDDGVLNSEVAVTNDRANQGLVNTGGHSRTIPEFPNNNDVTDLESLLLDAECDNSLQEEIKVSPCELMRLLREIIRACSKSLIIVQDNISKRTDVINNVINFSTLRHQILSGQLEKLEILEKSLRLIFFFLTLNLPENDPVRNEASLQLKFTEQIFKNYRDKIMERSMDNSFLNDSTASTMVISSNGDDPDQVQDDTHDEEIVFVCEQKYEVGGDIRGDDAGRRQKRARDLSPDITALTSSSSAPLKRRKKQLGKKKTLKQSKAVQETREKNSSYADCEDNVPSTSSSVTKSAETSATTTSEKSGDLDMNETRSGSLSDTSNDSHASTQKRGRFTSKNLS